MTQSDLVVLLHMSTHCLLFCTCALSSSESGSLQVFFHFNSCLAVLGGWSPSICLVLFIDYPRQHVRESVSRVTADFVSGVSIFLPSENEHDVIISEHKRINSVSTQTYLS